MAKVSDGKKYITCNVKQAKGGDVVAMDPVCGMEVDEKTAKFKTEYKGQTYYFCAPGCKFMFEKDPEKYLREGPVGME